MGMSASQARLLSLTSRLSDLEYEAQSISNSKIRLADQSAEASKKYEDALDAKKLQVKDSDTSTYVDASAYNLTTFNAISELDKQRFLCDNSGRILVAQSVADAFAFSTSSKSHSYSIQNNLVTSAGKVGYGSSAASLAQFLADYGVVTEAGQKGYDKDKVTYYTNLFSGNEDFLNSMGYTSASEALQKTDVNAAKNAGAFTYDKSAVNYYGNTYSRMDKDKYTVIGQDKLSDTEWLYEQLTNGNLFLSEWKAAGGKDGKGAWENISHSSGDSSITTTSDTTALAKAEAQYETVNAQIQAQDNKYDLELKTIDTEHTAISTEIESVKKVIDKNIERTFKIFDA